MQMTRFVPLAIAVVVLFVVAYFSAGWFLAVNFQEVVHSALTGNADVAKPQ